MQRKNTILIQVGVGIGAVLAVGATIYGAMYIANRQIHASTTQEQPVCGPGYHAGHTVVIQNDVATPANTVAPACDTLTITNLDARGRLMAFGLHEKHTPYDGVTERLLERGQSLTVTLVQTGNFKFHDHLQDAVQGTFTVTAAK